jgi:hypothetical protein
MARPFMFAVLCYSAHPLKHSLAESENSEKSSLAEKFVSRGHSLAEVSLYLHIHGEGSCGLVINVRKFGSICALSRPLLLVKYKSYNLSLSPKVQNMRRKRNVYKT